MTTDHSGLFSLPHFLRRRYSYNEVFSFVGDDSILGLGKGVLHSLCDYHQPHAIEAGSNGLARKKLANAILRGYCRSVFSYVILNCFLCAEIEYDVQGVCEDQERAGCCQEQRWRLSIVFRRGRSVCGVFPMPHLQGCS